MSGHNLEKQYMWNQNVDFLMLKERQPQTEIRYCKYGVDLFHSHACLARNTTYFIWYGGGTHCWVTKHIEVPSSFVHM